MRKRNNSCRERLAHLIRKTGLTQKELAEKAGIRESSLSNYMQGKSNPNMDIICKLSEALDVSTDWLLGYGELKEGTKELWEAKLLEKYNAMDFSTQEIIHEILGIHPVSSDWVGATRGQHGFTDKEIMDRIESVKPANADDEKELIRYMRSIINLGNKEAALAKYESYIQSNGPLSKAANEQAQKLLDECRGFPDV